MKICMFTDAHYAREKAVSCGNRFCSRSLKKLQKMLQDTADCALYIDLGDTIDGGAYESARRGMEEYRALFSGRRLWRLRGNHDGCALPASEDPDEVPGLGNAHSYALPGGRAILLDGCFYRDGRAYDGTPGDWRDCALPDAQCAFLEAELRRCERAWVLVHQQLDPQEDDSHVLKNAARVRRILEESGKVRHVFQGHYHPGMTQRVGTVTYHTLPALCVENLVRYWLLTGEGIGNFEIREVVDTL